MEGHILTIASKRAKRGRPQKKEDVPQESGNPKRLVHALGNHGICHFAEG